MPLGRKDIVTINYMKQNDIFADAFNYFVYGGEQVIHPENLEELDTRETDIPYGGEAGAEQPVQKTRDIIKSMTAMTDKRAAYLLLAIENQAHIHYAMPVKNLVYDALQYAKQVQNAVKSHKKSGDYKGTGSDEYLSGFMKEDYLMPVVTLVVYFGSKPWDGPMSVHEMFGEGQALEILSLVPDYRINLLAPKAIPNEDFEKFNTTLRDVLAFIKYSDDRDKLKNLLDSDTGFQRLGRKEIDVLNTCVNANLVMDTNEEVADVCKAIQDMIEEATEKVVEEAAAERAAMVKRMLKTGKLTLEEIAEYSGLTIEEIKAFGAGEQ